MNRFLRFVFVTMGAVILLMLVWLATPSSVFYKPISLAIAGRDLTFLRETPFGPVTVHWIGEVTMLDKESLECMNEGSFIGQDGQDELLTVPVGEWAYRCIDQGKPFILRYQFQVMLGGVLPLRPTDISVTINKPTKRGDTS